ncbi:hypothetical protein PsorP6_008452 [Peronosclerospora sorghi]|uniref:Uncharacterized protein n=1 Tax=Peronosclerospora sorghi TaxID=230839 RepID=A0ACC0WAQ3_9STRA|nr:hypothetical protein PsorP6_008452 [Peronosclerospora sorghi]
MILESRVYDVAEQTPLQVAPVLSHTLQNRVLLKREDMQPVFSFKIRGAYNKMAQLTDAEKAAGCVCCSAGNHAQGVALSARKLGIRAKIVMPLATPDIKVNAVRHHGQDFVEIVLHGKTFDDAAEEARRLVEEEKLTLILPFDDPYIIAGQGTVGLEILQQTSGSEDKVDAIFVPSGGGGMLAGIAAWVKQIRPSVKVVGVEAADAAGMTASLAAGHVVELDHVGLFADGAAVKRVGTETFRVCAQYVDEMVTVSTDEICAAIKAGFKDTRSILEPAGVLSVAGVSQYAKTRGLSGCTFVAVTSGANIDFARLRFVSERADSNERLLAVEIDEIPGAFLRLNRRLDAVGVRITEFSYRYDDAQKARVHLSFHSPTPEHTTAAIQELQRKSSSVGSAPACGGSHQVLDLSDNELAKVHTRYVAGGRARGNLENERLYRFEFPDHPRALATFLEALQSSWNMSLFHYRNHGADVGRVLVGFQVAEQDSNRFQAFLNQLGYVFHEETNNPMYQEFML